METAWGPTCIYRREGREEGMFGIGMSLKGVGWRRLLLTRAYQLYMYASFKSRAERIMASIVVIHSISLDR